MSVRFNTFTDLTPDMMQDVLGSSPAADPLLESLERALMENRTTAPMLKEHLTQEADAKQDNRAHMDLISF